MAQSESPLTQMKKLGAYRPGFKFGFRSPSASNTVLIEEFPFNKSWPAIFFVPALLALFSMPLFLMDFGSGEIDDLFDLTASLFSIFWAVGRSTGIGVMALILMAMIFAKEVLIVEPIAIRLRIELFSLGIESSSPLEYISNLRYVENAGEKGSTWRGKHLAFDYLQIPVSFGSDISGYKARGLLLRIQQTLQHPVPPVLSARIQKKI